MRRALLALSSTLLACSSCSSPQRARDASASATPLAARGAPPAADPRVATILDEALGAARAEGLQLREDPALTETARALIERVRVAPAHRAPSARVIQAVAWRAGVFDPIPAVVVIRRSAGAPDATSRDGLRELVRSERPTHLGVARLPLEGDELVVLALTRRRVSLAPLRVSLHRGETLRLVGALLDDAHDPTLVVTHPDGATRERALPRGASLDASVSFDVAGVWQVEVMASSSQGSTVVANFPVYVDASAPTVPGDEGPETASDSTAVSAELQALLSEARRRAGRSSLSLSSELSAIAQAHSDDMAAHGFVAHVSPTTGGPADRLRRAGFASTLALENVARGYGPREIHEGLMASPGHRANLLHPEVTLLGVGVTRERSGAGWLVTQVFAEVPRAIDAGAEVARLLASVNALRRTRGLSELATSAPLSAAAEHAARSFFENPALDQQAVFQNAARQVQRDAALFRRVSVAGALGSRAAQAEQLQGLLEPTLSAIGIAVAQGDRPPQPARSVITVVVTAVRR